MLFKSLVVSTLLAALSTATPLQTRQYPYFGSINELGYCINPFNTLACFAAQGHADAASSAAQSNFPSSLHNGKGDAYRHCYWNARMTIDIGATKAKEIGDAHEAGSSGPQAEKNMDLSNNATGSKDAKYANAEVTCRTRANNGQLVTL
ncbi:secreted protein [Coprinopsis sp. MPI-PUGE-AT-0042]|nr:secreted protein [Coprinopsis sp. MPI-PUGE-AT-0042]